MSIADTPDWQSPQQQTVVASAAVSASPGSTAVLVDPGSTKSIRLWSLSMFTSNYSTTLYGYAAIKTDAGEYLDVLGIGTAPASGQIVMQNSHLPLGGIVLPKGAKLLLDATSVQSPGATVGVAVYSLV